MQGANASVLTNSELPRIRECLSVLVIDDDPIFLHLISRYLDQDERYDFNVDTCKSAFNAIGMCATKHYDVLLIDHYLPDLSGAEFLQELRSRINGTLPPAIILTADTNDNAQREASDAHADDFILKKVVNTESLSRSMHNAISRYKLQTFVDQRTIELEKLNQDLQKKNREIRDFYQTVSHEVKTPLAAAREFVAIIRDGLIAPVTDEQVEILDHAIASCDQIANHFNDLIEITRLDAGKVLLRIEEVPLKTIITRSATACTASLHECEIALTQSIEDEDIMLKVDPDRISQVLSNLLGNAIKYSEPKTVVKLSVHRNNEDCVEFCVADTGCGIEKQDHEKIFDRLFQTSDATHEFMGAGLGLGLSIAKEIVLLHNGKIWVDSEPGVGSRFYFSLPTE